MLPTGISQDTIPDQDVPILIGFFCLAIRSDWSNRARVRKWYCMALELAVRYDDKEIIDTLLEYQVESQNDGRWLREVYYNLLDPEYKKDHDDARKIDDEALIASLSDRSKDLLRHYKVGTYTGMEI